MYNASASILNNFIMTTGTLEISFAELPKIGDRDDFKVRVVGPGETDYSFPLSITRTISSIWGNKPDEATKLLTQSLIKVYGTAKAPPEEGFWFDSYNSGNTLRETQNIIANKGITPFRKGAVNQAFVKQFGNDLFALKEELNSFFINNHGRELFSSFEDAFEDSEAIEDLNNPPKDKAHFLYRVCILSVFIDHFNIRKEDEEKKTGSLQAFRKWLQKELDEDKANELIRPFQMIKNLRKRYPIHEEYEVNADGIRKIRKEVKSANEYFGLKDSYEDDWHKVMTIFAEALIDIRKNVSETN